MKITRKSILTGIVRTIELPISEKDLKRYENGDGLIQNIFPNLSKEEREFIMTGVTSDEWDEVFQDEE